MRKHRSARITNAALGLLEEAGIKRPPVQPEVIARKLGARMLYTDFEDEISGVLYRDKGATIIAVNSLHHPNRQRFTVAHEVGHLVLHHMDTHVDKAYRMVLRDSTSSQATDPREIEANQFAAELLMPETMVERDAVRLLTDVESQIGLEKLAKLYRVSPQAMAFRLANLGIVE